MGFALQFKTNEFTVNGQTFVVGTNSLPIFGYRVGVFAKQPDGSFLNHIDFINYSEGISILDDIKAKGGKVKYFQWVVAQINAGLAKLFGGGFAPVVEPASEQQAMDLINSYISTLKITMVNGVPTVG